VLSTTTGKILPSPIFTISFAKDANSLTREIKTELNFIAFSTAPKIREMVLLNCHYLELHTTIAVSVCLMGSGVQGVSKGTQQHPTMQDALIFCSCNSQKIIVANDTTKNMDKTSVYHNKRLSFCNIRRPYVIKLN